MDRPRLDLFVGDAPVAPQGRVHEENADQVGRNLAADDFFRLRFSGSTASPSSRGRLTPFCRRLDAHQVKLRRLALRLGLDLPLGARERKLYLVLAQSQRLPAFFASPFPFARLTQILDDAAALFDQVFRRDSIEHQSNGGSFLRCHRLARADDIDRVVQSDQSRQPLRPSPARDETDRHFGEADPRFRIGRGQPLIKGQRKFRPAPHAGPVNQRNGWKRKIADAVEQGVPSCQRDPQFVRGQVHQRPQFLEVGPGDKLTRLAAPQQQAFEVGAPGELPDELSQLIQDGSRQRIDLLLGRVEDQHGDRAGKLFESEDVGHVETLDLMLNHGARPAILIAGCRNVRHDTVCRCCRAYNTVRTDAQNKRAVRWNRPFVVNALYPQVGVTLEARGPFPFGFGVESI